MRVGDAICEDDAHEVNVLDMWHRRKCGLFVLLVDDRDDVGCIYAAIALHSNMEGHAHVFRLVLQEELDERVDIFGCDRAGVHRQAVIRVGVADVDGLVEEDHVGVHVPAVLVVCDVLAFVYDVARDSKNLHHCQLHVCCILYELGTH